MKKFLAVAILVFTVALLATGCKSHHSGSREYTPGKGWQHTD